MKKLALIFLVLTIFTAYRNENKVTPKEYSMWIVNAVAANSLLQNLGLCSIN